MSRRSGKQGKPTGGSSSSSQRQQRQPVDVQAGRDLDMVTGFLLTPQDFPGELSDSYSAVCALLRVRPESAGYAVLLCQDGDGARWSQITTDTAGFAGVLSLEQTGIQTGYVPPSGTVIAVRPGWPLECRYGFADRAAPHDLPGVAPQDLLRPPPADDLPAARRRSLADILSEELATSGRRSRREYKDDILFDAYNMGDHPLEVPPRLIDMRVLMDDDHPAYASLQAALATAWTLSEDPAPGPGRIRVRKSWPRDTPVVRASGADWTLVALADGPAVMLLDEIPGIPLALDETPRIAELVTALAAAAKRCPA
ncbi:hypothetical protein [Planomonospora sp. ID82291]|uniref:hypothetical protein n=1 Tax=Planomonospora sp. ID82291 TaxID=2738136 RepID=UPI0018C427CF|nr:hypothetical protein [Planomonospora sp. ID82291]MBG0818354.1 hypothetical protein [Planomonospora sp. ID82291]